MIQPTPPLPPATERPFSRPDRWNPVVPGRGRPGGFTILETMVASALLMLFLTSLFALNSTVMRMLRSATETADASQELQWRVEKLRLANWTQITSPTSVRDLLQVATDATLDLPDVVETVLARPYSYDQPEQAPAFKWQRAPDKTMTPAPDGPAATGRDLSKPDVSMVRFDVTVAWRSWGGRSRTRTLTTVVSRMGVSK